MDRIRRRDVRVAVPLLTLALLLVAAETGTIGLIGGFLLALVPVPFYIALALWLDRFEAEPAHLLARAFGWGAVVAFPAALLINTLWDAATASPIAGITLIAPVVEELGKGAAVGLLFLLLPHEFDNVTDGIVYATLVGLGFATGENILYYGRALVEGTMSGTFLLRGVAAPFAHPLFTAMTGIGFGLAREAGRSGTRSLAPLLGFLGAVTLHVLWNAAAQVEPAFGLVYVGVMVPAFAATLWAVRRSLGREAEVLRIYLTSLVECGELPEEELQCLCSARSRLLCSWKALRSGGVAAWRARWEFHQTASEIAFHHWRVSRGISAGNEADIACERAHRARLRALLARFADPADPQRSGAVDCTPR